MESFKSFMEWFIVHYCTHFDTIDPVFQKEFKFIEATKDEIAKHAQNTELL